jgi:uncharacterized protein (UPF0210 family)
MVQALRNAACALGLLASSLVDPSLAHAAAADGRPKVRAITAFVRVDRPQASRQLLDAAAMLRAARARFQKDGWDVETIRITTQPFPEYVRGLAREEALGFLLELDALAVKEDFLLALGPAMSQDDDDPAMVDLLAELFCRAKVSHGTTLLAGEDGIRWKTVRATARLVKSVADRSRLSQGNFNFTAAAMMPEYAPFYPASYHRGPGHRFSVGLEGANVVDRVFGETAGDPAAASRRLAAELAKYTSLAESSALSAAKESGWEYLGIDPTPAPALDASIGAAVERFTGHRFGSSGTLSAARLITEAVKAVPAKQVGYSGLMVPVLEDRRLAQRWSEGAIGIDGLLAYSAVCATGLDTVPLPGDVSEEQIARILGDVASLAYKWRKPLTARLLPVAGKGPGQRTAFDDPSLENAALQPLP